MERIKLSMLSETSLTLKLDHVQSTSKLTFQMQLAKTWCHLNLHNRCLAACSFILLNAFQSLEYEMCCI